MVNRKYRNKKEPSYDYCARKDGADGAIDFLKEAPRLKGVRELHIRLIDRGQK
jgi:hypothetical protein